mmetsp:Transcript_96454/g.268020  ORF Transcript_96454/g.268020 Transcript_96454/m.268020 type:complete len:244 (+) Transcript_96454:71-802(+)
MRCTTRSETSALGDGRGRRPGLRVATKAMPSRPITPTPASSSRVLAGRRDLRVLCREGRRSLRLPAVPMEEQKQQGHKYYALKYEAADGRDEIGSAGSSTLAPCLPPSRPQRTSLPVRSRVSFRLAENTEHSVTPYSQVYGDHPNFFNFDRNGCKSFSSSRSRSSSPGSDGPQSPYASIDLFAAAWGSTDKLPPTPPRSAQGLCHPMVAGNNTTESPDPLMWSPLPRLPRPPSPPSFSTSSWW